MNGIDNEILVLTIQTGLLVVALVAVAISIIQLHSHNNKENNKLLSQLNKRYIEDENVQKVVRYLRKNDPSNEEPDAYQVELFLRFFEELGIYLKTKSIRRKDVKEFFGYYFDRYEDEKNERGKILKSKIHNEDTNKDLPYLRIYRKEMNINK